MGNLSFQTTREELTTLFSGAGSIVDVVLPTDRETGQRRGFAFVEFSSDAEAAEAIRSFNEREVGGRKLSVTEARDRTSRPEGSSPFRSPAPPFGANPSDGRGRPSRNKPIRSKGSRRGLRARKRSL